MPSTKAPPGHFALLYFASASSFTSKDLDYFEAPLPVSKLFETLDRKYPGMKDKVLRSSAVTVNLEYVNLEQDDPSRESGVGADELMIKEGDEVAIIPPSGRNARLSSKSGPAHYLDRKALVNDSAVRRIMKSDAPG